MKSSTIALVVRPLKPPDPPQSGLVEVISNDQEIDILEAAIDAGEPEPLELVKDHRLLQNREEEEFGNYIEQLLSQRFLNPEIQEHGVRWFKSKIKIEKYQKTEVQAANVIADYAYKVFLTDPAKTDFFFASPSSKVRVRIFVMQPEGHVRSPNSARKAA